MTATQKAMARLYDADADDDIIVCAEKRWAFCDGSEEMGAPCLYAKTCRPPTWKENQRQRKSRFDAGESYQLGDTHG